MIASIYSEPDLVGEPTLEEMFAEPMIRLIMQRDGVEDVDLRKQINRVSQSYRMLEQLQ